MFILVGSLGFLMFTISFWHKLAATKTPKNSKAFLDKIYSQFNCIFCILIYTQLRDFISLSHSTCYENQKKVRGRMVKTCLIPWIKDCFKSPYIMKSEISSFLCGDEISISFPFHFSGVQIYFNRLLKAHQFDHPSTLLLSCKKSQPIPPNPAATAQWRYTQSELWTHHSWWWTIVQGVLSPCLGEKSIQTPLTCTVKNTGQNAL